MLEATMMVIIAALVWTRNGADGFPFVNYTGQNCSSALAQATSRCTSEKTSMLLSSNMQDASNGTHAFVFLGEPFEISCCTPSKSNSSSDILATLSQREITYTLHSGSPSAELSVMKGNQLNRKLTTYNHTDSNSICEYSTVSIPKTTYSEVGKWTCAAYDGNTPKAELQVIVGEIGQLSSEFVDVGESPTAYVSFTLDGYAPAGAKLELQVGTSRSNLASLTANGAYGNGTILISGFNLPVEKPIGDCKTIKNVYDTVAGGNFSMTACRYKIKTSFNVTRLTFGREHMYLWLDASIQFGWRRPLFSHSEFLLTYRDPPMTTPSVIPSTVVAPKAQASGVSLRNEGCLGLTFASVFLITVAAHMY